MLVVERHKPYTITGLTYEQGRDQQQKSEGAWDVAKSVEGKGSHVPDW